VLRILRKVERRQARRKIDIGVVSENWLAEQRAERHDGSAPER
jgi:hypothetical protein